MVAAGQTLAEEYLYFISVKDVKIKPTIWKKRIYNFIQNSTSRIWSGSVINCMDPDRSIKSTKNQGKSWSKN
jgi:hypothetical protein